MRPALVLVFALALLGCDREEPVDECARVRSDCPNEPSLVEECRAIAPTCPATARALFLCMAAHQVCDGRGRLARGASLGLCAEQRAENDRCLAGAAPDAAPDANETSVEDTGVEDAGDDVQTG